MSSGIDRYADIIHLPRPVSGTRKRMTALERAAQFSPFAALVGFDAAIREEGRRTSRKPELAEDEKLSLDRKYRFLSDCLAERPWVRVTFFRKDSRKEGGAVLHAEGCLTAISSQDQWLCLEGVESISFYDILGLESPIFMD